MGLLVTEAFLSPVFLFVGNRILPPRSFLSSKEHIWTIPNPGRSRQEITGGQEPEQLPQKITLDQIRGVQALMLSATPSLNFWCKTPHQILPDWDIVLEGRSLLGPYLPVKKLSYCFLLHPKLHPNLFRDSIHHQRTQAELSISPAAMFALFKILSDLQCLASTRHRDGSEK